MKFSAIKVCALIGLAGLIFIGFRSHAQPVAAAKNKVIIYPSAGETIGQLQKQGITKVDNYGSYWVAEVGDQDLARLKATHGDRVVMANHLNRIEMSTGSFDTRIGEPAIPEQLRQSAPTGRRLRLVQFKGPMQPEWLEQVKAAGHVKVLSYIPNNAYVVMLDDEAENNLKQLMDPAGPIQWVGAYHPYYKMRASLRDGTQPTVEVCIAVADGPDVDQTIQIIQGYTLTPPGEIVRTRQQVLTQITVLRKELLQIAQLPDVLWIQQVFPVKNMDEQSDIILTTSDAGTPFFSYVNFLANAGFSIDQLTYPVLDIADTGLDEPNPNCNVSECGSYVPFVTTFHPCFYSRSFTIGEVSACPQTETRVLYRDATDTDGHGTYVASVAAGLDTLPDETVICITESNGTISVGGSNVTGCVAATNAASPPFPDNVVRQVGLSQAGLGVSPYGRIGSSPQPAAGEDFAHAQTVYLRTARISNNSWGQPLDRSTSNSPPANAGIYDARSQAYDILTRDSLNTGSTNPPTSGTSPLNQEMIWVFAGGNVNDLRGAISDIGGIPDVTVTPPATAKNIISVGAITKSEPEQIGIFSAFGPTEDGRFKPEIMAPGVDIFGATSQATYVHPLCGGCNPFLPSPAACSNNFHLRDTITELYGPASGVHNLLSGTSFSAPAVAGGVQLLWWWFENKFRMLQPSPAMAKAYLCNSARYIPLTNSVARASDRLPSIAQGMGRMDLTRMFDGVPRVLRDETTPRALDTALLVTNSVSQQTFFTRSGQTYETSGVVASNGAPFRVTLTWTDAPGDPTAFKQLVNDLDLEVTIGGQTYKGNIFNTQYSTIDPSRTADSVNNTESVFLPTGTTGTWSVVVRASNIAGDAVPNVSTSLAQDFALVVYNAATNAFGSPSAPSDAPNLTTNDTCQTAISITNFFFSFTNSLTTASYSDVHPSPTAARGGIEEFFKIPLPGLGSVYTITSTGSNSLLSVWRGNCGALIEVDSTASLPGSINFTADGSDDYYIVVDGLNGGDAEVELNVSGSCPIITLTPSSLPAGSIGQSYNQAITPTNGTAPYQFAVTSGSLPGGLSLSGLGVISGTPSAAGTFPFTLAAIDKNGCTGTVNYTIPVSCSTITLSPALFPGGTIGVVYNQSSAAVGGVAPYAFSVTNTLSGTSGLPPGLTYSSGGVLSGTPTLPGTYNFVITATDAGGCSASRAYSLAVGCPTMTFSPTSLSSASVGQPYNQAISVSGGSSNTIFSLLNGPLPAGLALTTSGVITGVPTAIPTPINPISIKVGAVNTNTTCSAVAYYAISVTCPTITLSPSSLPFGQEFSSYGPVTLTATGGTPPYTFSQTAGSLPSGMTISSNGVLSGTPTSPSSQFTVTATDTYKCVGTRVYTLILGDPPTPPAPISLAPSSLPDGVVGQNYNSSVTASGGTAPYSFAKTGGTLPTGLSLSGAGALTGTPTATGPFTFTVTATDSSSSVEQTSLSYTITISSNADLAVSGSLTPQSVVVGDDLTYTVTVTNIGPSAATGVTINNSLSATVHFLSASNSNVGSLSAGEGRTVSYLVHADTSGAISATASVSANETDPNAANNSATASGTVKPPYVVASNPKSIIDTDGDTVSVTLKGSGTMEVRTLGGDNQGPIDQIVLTGTDASSSLTIKVKRGSNGDGLVNIGSIVGNGGLKSINGKTVSLTGSGIQLGGSLGSLKANALRNSALTVGGAIGTVQLQQMSGSTCTAGGSIKSVNVKTYSGSTINAMSVGAIKLGSVNTANGNQSFGITVQQAGGTVSVGTPRLKWKITTSSSSGDFHVTLQ